MPSEAVDKNARGRVLVIGGCLQVPGGIQLTAEAALRAGAGKVRIGTVASAVIPIGTLLPEVGMLPLPEGPGGEIEADVQLLVPHLSRSDALVVGPAMACEHHASRLVEAVLDAMALARLDALELGLVIDASALMRLADHAARLRTLQMSCVLTPHIGEMAALLGREASDIERDRVAAARQAADRFDAVIVLKGATTLVADPGGACFVYSGGNVGLATGGSGDVLAGIVGALLARGARPLDAALWAVWLHGEAGRHCAQTIGPVGYLARELLIALPRMLGIASEE
ncbi:NAD(P)H-hydrate dehydratase [Novosphingobium sp. BL-8H]